MRTAVVSRSKIEKYAVHCDNAGTWWARVPWGTYRSFGSWREAAAYLAMRHDLKVNNKPYRRTP